MNPNENLGNDWQKQANKVSSERNLETVKNTHLFEKIATFSHILSKQGNVLA